MMFADIRILVDERINVLENILERRREVSEKGRLKINILEFRFKNKVEKNENDRNVKFGS